MRNQEIFAGKVVVITGGTSGIGAATVRAFAFAGAHVYFCGRRTTLGQALMTDLREQGFSACFVKADVRIAADMDNFIREAVRRHGCVDIAFNNAGINHPPFLAGETPEAIVADVMATNFTGVQNAMRAEIPVISRPGGVIINNASVLASEGANWMSAYGASKHAVLGLTRSAALDYRRDGIRICSISPGPVKTPMFEKAMQEIAGDKKKFAGGLPRGGLLEPEQVAEKILFMAHPDSSVAAGENIVIDPRISKV